MSELDADGAPTMDRSPAPEIAGFRDFSKLGDGESSIVWRAFQEEFDRWVAIKVLRVGHAQGPALERFEREKRISAKLGGHPYIVQVFSTGKTRDGQPYMSMDLCEYGSIDRRLESQGAFTVDEALDVAIKISDAVKAAHEAGLLHRDIKPQNVLLAKYGPALTDFGISRATDATQWTESLLHLTVNHAAPETFLDAPPSVATDIYALGSTLYTMLAGQAAFRMGRNETLTQFLVRLEREPLPPFRRTDVPEDLRQVIERAMAKSPADRYPTAAAFGDALRAVQLARTGQMTAHTTSRDIGRTAARPTTMTAHPSRPPTTDLLLTTPGPVTSSDTIVIRGPAVESSPAVSGLASPDTTQTVIRPRPGRELVTETVAPAGNARRNKRLWWIAGVLSGGLLVAILAVTLLNPSSQDNAAKREITANVPEIKQVDTGTPTDLRVTHDGGTFADLAWTDTSAGGTSHFLVITVREGGKNQTAPVSGAMTYTARNLDPSAPYCFVVRAIIDVHTNSKDAVACIRGGRMQSTTTSG